MPLIAYGRDASGIKSTDVQGRHGATVLQRFWGLRAASVLMPVASNPLMSMIGSGQLSPKRSGARGRHPS